MYLHIRTHVYVYETSWITITLNNCFKLVTVCRLLNLWKILLPISNLAIIMLYIMHAFKLTWLRMNMFPSKLFECLCCSLCANKAYHQHYQEDITTIVIMMNLTALNYYIRMYVHCSLFSNTSRCKISHKCIISITH